MELTEKEIELITKWRYLSEGGKDSIIKIVELFTDLIQSSQEKRDEKRF